MPPIQIGGPPGRCGTGPSVTFSMTQRPFQVTGRPLHNSRHSRSPSSMRPTRFSNGTPQATNSARMFGTSLAMPTPRMNRPSLIWSRVAMPCASTTGLRSAGSSTAVPSSARLGARRHRRQQGQRLVPRPGRDRIADPDRIVAERLGAFGQRQQRRRLGAAFHDLLAGRQQVSDAHGHARPPAVSAAAR